MGSIKRYEGKLYESLGAVPAGTMPLGAHTVPARFGDVRIEHEHAVRGLAIHHRPYRSLLEITGADRHAWLHNLTTNEVKNLQLPDGAYAFVLNVKGRILFDVNILVDESVIRLDLDSRYLAAGLEHFNHYVIMEDVTITDRTEAFDRWAVLGAGLSGFGSDVGVANLSSLASLQSASATLGGPVQLVRHDFSGLPAAELFVPNDTKDAHIEKLAELCKKHDIRPIGYETIETLRIEEGLPALGADIDETVLPAETLQLERGVSFQKGCYLGQEVVERMRSRGSLAKQLVGVAFSGEVVPPVGATLHVGDKEGGRLTSACFSPVLGQPIGLGYLKTLLIKDGAEVVAHAEEGEFVGRLHALPFTPR